jgi:extracellular factor (EF) 3-hydroxypalmitic acid methyl ester biosynthesis protein
MEDITTVRNKQPTEGLVVCENSHGTEIHGTLLRLSRHEVAFELYSVVEPLRISEVLNKFTILSNDQQIYSGRGIVTSLVNAGPVVVCQANLEDSWLQIDVLDLAKEPARLPDAFRDLIEGWQRVYKISSEYKVVIADIQSFLFELRHWVDEVALGLSGAENGQRGAAEMRATDELVKPVKPCLDHLFEKFELACAEVPPELQPAHSTYVRRQLHPLLLSAPFMHRIFRKPLGYAGDYEMVNMIIRDPREGSSLCARVLNSWFLSQIPAEAHRNRVKFLTERLIQEAGRLRLQQRPLRVYNLGCGPAREVLEFMAQSEFSNNAEISLLDFNEETLEYARQTLEETRRRHNRTTRIQLIKRSVGQVLKSSLRSVPADIDFVYCAGLFDYLPDRVCAQLMTMFYNMLAPGGLLIATNVDPSNPIRFTMDYIFEWRLIERSAEKMRALLPALAPPDSSRITSDITGCNVFIEVRKPAARS